MEPLLTLKDWQNGTGDSPHVGLGMLKNVEIDTLVGSARVGKLPITVFHTAYSQTFTADASTNVCTAAGGTLGQTHTAVVLTTTGTLPAGLATGTVYFIIKTAATTFKLATTIANADAGTAIDITDVGSGVHTVATVNPGTIRHYSRDPRTSTVFLMDSNGRAWFLEGGATPAQLLHNSAIDSGSGALTNAAGQGLAVFRVSDGSATYLFAFRNALVDVINVYGSSNLETPVWSNAWKSMNSGAGSGNSHHARLGQDNIIYFCDDRYVGSIKENAGSVFDPASAGTYTYNNQALDLPLGSLTYWLEELGVNLMISVSNDSYLYPWDRVSDSYGLPIPIGEYGGNKMKNIGNVLYVLAGTHGNIYTTQGTYCRLFKTLPQYLVYNTTTPASNPITWGGIEAALGNLLVGVTSAGSGNSGVYMVTPDGRLTIDNQPSSGNVGVTALFALSEFYHLGFAGGAELLSTARYTSLGADVDNPIVCLQSPFYRLGDNTGKATISDIEYQIAAAVSGSIRLSYRTKPSGAFTSITTWTTTSAASDSVDAGLTNIENIQFQVELAGSIDFMELRCYK